MSVMSDIPSKRLSRRDFLTKCCHLGLATTVGASSASLLAACAQTEAPTTVPTKAPAAAASGSSAQGVTTLRLGHIFATDHYEETMAKKWNELISQKTGGKMELKSFPTLQLGSEDEMTEQVRQGALDMLTAGATIQNLVPELSVLGLPGLWKGEAHFNKFQSSDVGKKLAQVVLEKTGIRVLGWTTTGTRIFLHRSKYIRKTSEFAGLKIRVDTMPSSAAIWKAVGASPVPMAFGEVYTSLQTGVVDAAENPPMNIITQKFYEVGKYLTRTNHQLTVFVIMMNDKRYQGLPADLRSGFDAAFQEYLPLRTKAAFNADVEALDKLKALGAEAIPLEDPDAFAAAMQPMHKEFADKYKIGEYIDGIKALAS